jgi:hypothetical protein
MFNVTIERAARETCRTAQETSFQYISCLLRRHMTLTEPLSSNGLVCRSIP